MHPLTAAMPDTEVRRSDIVAARLARKVGPLFGVVWEQNPFGCTWVCDFATITLAEIARGAPFPTRDAQSAMDSEAERGIGGAPDRPDGHAPAWRRAGRAVWTFRREPTPAAIAHATLNRYGPDTKAAVVLTGANRLLAEVTAAVADVCRWLAEQGATPEVRLAVWAGLVLEAFRGQPALMAAAIQARAVQRALTAPWGQHLGLAGPSSDPARCEFGAGNGHAQPGPTGQKASLQIPTVLDLVDATLPLLGLPLPIDDGPLMSQMDLLDDIAGWWCRRLLQIGRPGRGIAWVAEAAPGHRSVQTYVRVGAVVAPFVAEVLSALSIADGPGRRVEPEDAYRLLPAAGLAQRPLLTRRAHLIATHVLASYLRFHDDLLAARPELRASTRALTGAASALATESLGAEDPASLLLAGYAAYCEAWDLHRTSCQDPALHKHAAADLADHLDRLTRACQEGVLDPGTASYLLEIGVMALERANEAADLSADLSRLWRDAMLARGVDPDRDLDDPRTLPASQRYHLQNYAAFLASRATSPAGLRHALAAQRACVEVREQVAEGELAEYQSKFTSTRTSRQVAAAISGRLLDMAGPQDPAERSELLAEGIGHVRAAITNPMSQAIIAAASPDPEVVRLALATLPVVVAAWESHHPAVDAGLLVDAERLLRAATGCAGQMGQILPAADRLALARLRERMRGLVPV